MIENNAPDIVLPAELKKRVEAVKHQITVDEAHIANLRKTRSAEEYAIRESVKQKAQLEKEIEVLKQEVEKTLVQANECRLDIHELSKKKKYAQAEVATLDEEIAERKAWNDQREENLATEEKNLAKRGLALAVREKEVAETKKRVDSLFEKVSDAVKQF
jgi:chromosome segregation ATPase